MYKQTYKGLYRVKNIEKYKGDITNVVYRSLWELRFMKWCDTNDGVLEWGSEIVVIPYVSPVDNNIHRYFVDFYIKIKNKNDEIKKYIIEIKPKKFTVPPKMPSKKTKQYVDEVFQYTINQAKWNAARKYCEKTNLNFMILTENELGINNKYGK